MYWSGERAMPPMMVSAADKKRETAGFSDLVHLPQEGRAFRLGEAVVAENYA